MAKATANSSPAPCPIPWQQVETILLDMDGTLLDRHFDDHFFLETVPKQYASQHAIPLAEAKEAVLTAYQKVERTLAWYDLDYWSDTLKMDIPLLKQEVAHLIQVHPHVIDFLESARQSGRPLYLVTNAHAHSLKLKMARTPIGDYFDQIVSSHTLGFAKEDQRFWQALSRQIDFNPATTLLADDSEPVLASAQQYGIGFPLHIAKPSSTLAAQMSKTFVSVNDFAQLLPVPPTTPPDFQID
uniref:Putative HAD-superfamily hydrolase n=1 Tax=Magnetococcus massalia (strain MO-1) TaxID=451514 RepID=A0A1S7LJL4_MAGMO|nr:putative HAD-superfamily hydrolase [Candidatus Magnetococcus massalia]